MSGEPRERTEAQRGAARSAAPFSRQAQKSVSERNVWAGGARLLVMSVFAFWKSEAEE